MTRYYVLGLNANKEVIAREWTYNRDEVKGLVKMLKRLNRVVKGVSVNDKIWMF